MTEPATLPNELISYILQFASTPTLMNATQGAHRLYGLATPHLYHRIKIKDDIERKAPRLKALTTLFLRKPALAHHVHHFSLRSDQESEYAPSDETSITSSVSHVSPDPERLAPISEAQAPLNTIGGGDSDGKSGHFRNVSTPDAQHSHSDRAQEYHLSVSEDFGLNLPEKYAPESEENNFLPDPGAIIAELSIERVRSMSSDSEDNSSQVSDRYSPSSYSPSENDLPEAVRAEAILSPIEFDFSPQARSPDFLRDYSDVYLSVLLPRLLNLETLDLEDPATGVLTWQMFGRVVKDSRNNKAFSRLKSVFWTRVYPQRGNCVIRSNILCYQILELPSIKTVCLHKTNIFEDSLHARFLEELATRGDCRFTHLEIRRTSLYAAEMLTLILASRNLKSLILDFEPLPGLRQNFNLDCLGIMKHKESLEELSLDINFYRWRRHFWHDGMSSDDSDFEGANSDGTNSGPPIQTLAMFARLKRLRIAAPFVFGPFDPPEDANKKSYSNIQKAELLPCGIEILHFTNCQEEAIAQALLDALEYAFSRKQVFTPSLSKVIIETGYRTVDHNMDQFKGILEIGREVGVDVVVLNNSGKDLDRNKFEPVERKWGFDEDIIWANCNDGENARPVFGVINIA